jgi:hypothetical protein
MPRIVYLACPGCKREFYVGPEFLTIKESYCCCPYCHAEFRPEESSVPLRFEE